MRPELAADSSLEARNVRLGFAIAVGVAPLVLWLVLNALRPDLIKPLLDHVFGYVLSAIELLFVLGGLVVYIIASQQKSAGAQVGISFAGCFVCTLPAVFLMLFGPIVFAFMFGAAPG